MADDEEGEFDWKQEVDKKKSKKDKKKKKKKKKDDKGEAADAVEGEAEVADAAAHVADDGFGGAVTAFQDEEEEDNSDLPDWKNLLKESVSNRTPYTKRQWENPADTDLYPYTVALGRIFGKLYERRGGSNRREVAKLPLPDVQPYGGRRCIFNNFPDIIKILKRDKDHVQAFYLAELACDGNFDARDRLIMRGRFRQLQLKSLLRKYIGEYVTCGNCRSPNTVLEKDSATRLYFLKCQQCGASRSVKPIRTGFQAEDRRTRRAKRYAVKQ